ncbi:MAG: DNA-binding transcriptional regulator [Planctomycetes bacterium]|nr:DNA-binding transcriptional regulator [Planctomycetota bacterium]
MGRRQVRPRSQWTVALLAETWRAYGRGLLQGVARYVRAHGHWLILHQEQILGPDAPRWLKRQPCDGIMARIETRRLLETVQQLNLPTVDLRGRFQAAGVPQVGKDDGAIARLAAEHLHERGFRHFAFCGFTGLDYSVRRRDAFVAWVREAGFQPLVYEGTPPSQAAAGTMQELTGQLYEEGLETWLTGLPRPLALMACNDLRGQQVLTACRGAGIRVPEEVAVLGVDNDTLLCDLADPPLSSVEPGAERIGYEAAALLEAMMQGRPPQSQVVLFPPLGVVTRQSTDILAVEDRRVAAALRLIREHAFEGLNVDGLLKHLAAQSCRVSRSTLERRFAETLGRSPKEEILRVRMARVKQLLIDTDYSLSAIARLVGIEHHEHLSALFKARTGETPGAFRRRIRRHSPDTLAASTSTAFAGKT